MKVRGLAEAGDELALAVFEQQAAALGRLFTIAANFTDPHAYFLGGGVVEAAPHFRSWFLDRVRANTELREEQEKVATLELVPDRDMAGARGAAIAARDAAEAARRVGDQLGGVDRRPRSRRPAWSRSARRVAGPE